jgi:hypothetical protein
MIETLLGKLISMLTYFYLTQTSAQDGRHWWMPSGHVQFECVRSFMAGVYSIQCSVFARFDHKNTRVFPLI